jgi:hypothetical protein
MMGGWGKIRGGQAKHCCVQVDAGRVTRQPINETVFAHNLQQQSIF